jgi:thiamine-monophosphate kinase
LGEAKGPVPPRAGARPGDRLWVSGTIGDSGAGLRILRGEIAGGGALVSRYRRPEPRLAAGTALAPLAGAMMDVSDGLLIDASRMAAASGARLVVDLAALPLSTALVDAVGSDRPARLAAATSGDDYELLFAAAPDRAGQIAAIGARLALPLTAIGSVEAGSGLRLVDGGEAVVLPARLGWEHF